MTVAITATVQDAVWPARVAVAVTGLSDDDVVQVWRRPTAGSTRTTIRGGSFTSDGSDFGVIDAEQPFGVALTYGVTVGGTDIDTAAIDAVTLTDTTIVLSDAIGNRAAAVFLNAYPKPRSRQGTLFVTAAGEHVGVFGPRGKWEGDITLETDTAAQETALEDLLTNATLGIVQLRCDGTLSGVDDYLLITSDSVQRFAQNPDHAWRGWQLHVAQVSAWPDALTAVSYTYTDFKNFYSGKTYADVVTDFAGKTYNDLRLSEFAT